MLRSTSTSGRPRRAADARLRRSARIDDVHGRGRRRRPPRRPAPSPRRWRRAPTASPPSARPPPRRASRVRLAITTACRRRARAGAAPPWRRFRRRRSPAPGSRASGNARASSCTAADATDSAPDADARFRRAPGGRCEAPPEPRRAGTAGAGRRSIAARTWPRISASPSTIDSRPVQTRNRWRAAALPAQRDRGRRAASRARAARRQNAPRHRLVVARPSRARQYTSERLQVASTIDSMPAAVSDACSAPASSCAERAPASAPSRRCGGSA